MTTTPTARVLIVDDELANVHALAEALGNAYDLSFATDGRRALQLALEQLPDLILLDVAMPLLNGFDVLRRLKDDARTQHVPVIFVTAMSELPEEELGFALGAVDYISKPVSAPRVRARVRNHIELKRQRDLLEQHAALDGLTGIANRRRFDQELDQRWRSAARHEHALTLMLLDVDHFKAYNDNYGHGPGDDCLRRVAGALAAGFARGDDFCARYGGEEFVLLLPPGDTAADARRLLAAVHGLAIAHAHSSAADRVTVSVGAYECLPSLGEPAAALSTVDALLYEAKRGGRNRCSWLRQRDGWRAVVEL